MSSIDFLVPLTVILVLILINGLFSAAEIAIVSLREGRLAQIGATEHPTAKIIVQLKRDSARFLATVQVGVTILSSMASVLGGAVAATQLGPALRQLLPDLLGPASETLALALTVSLLSYLSLVLGELVPKSIALRSPERLAFLTARLVHGVGVLSQPLVRFLTFSTDLVLRALGVPAHSQELLFSEEEVKHMVREGARLGIFDEAERQLIHSVFEFADTSVREVMVPRAEIVAVQQDAPLEDALRLFLETGFSRLPLFEGDLDHVVGIVHLKDVSRELQTAQRRPLRNLAHPPLFVPDSMQISDLLRELQARHLHMAIVVNEFGTVVGLVTIEDLLEEIVGEIRDEFDTDEEQPLQEMTDGSLLVHGSLPLDELTERYELPFRSTPDYRTVAGLVLARLKRFPKGGEAIVEGPYRLTVVVLEGRRLRKIRIEGPIHRRKTGEIAEPSGGNGKA